MNNYPRLLDEICEKGNLLDLRFALVKIFVAIEKNPCKISCQDISPISSITFLPEGPIIRIAVKNRKSPLHIIWDLLHEYGHFVIGPLKDNHKNEMVKSEYYAWEFASKLIDRLPELLPFKSEFDEYRKDCMQTYAEKLQLDYNVEAILKKYMPSIIELLGEQNFSWTPINKGLKAFIVKIRQEYNATGLVVMKETSFYSMLTEKAMGGNKADAMFDYYNELFKSLNAQLSVEEKKLVRRIVSQLLANLDNRHMNFIVELSVLNKYISTGDYRLVNIEEKISAEREVTVDFYFKRKSDNLEVLIEVLNIHLERSNIADYSKLKYHLDSKFNSKLKSKLASNERILSIQPVIWYSDDNQFRWIKEFFTQTEYSYENVLEPMCYCSFSIGNGKFEHRFDKIRLIS